MRIPLSQEFSLGTAVETLGDNRSKAIISQIDKERYRVDPVDDSFVIDRPMLTASICVFGVISSIQYDTNDAECFVSVC